MNAAVLAILGPDPLEIDPRPCGNCGLTIDRHQMVDDGEGPIFYCLAPMTLDELERRAELRRQEQVAAMLARWDAMDAMDAPSKAPPPRKGEPYRPAASTVQAFQYLLRLNDPDRLKRWLLEHRKDAAFLLNLLENA